MKIKIYKNRNLLFIIYQWIVSLAALISINNLSHLYRRSLNTLHANSKNLRWLRCQSILREVHPKLGFGIRMDIITVPTGENGRVVETMVVHYQQPILTQAKCRAFRFLHRHLFYLLLRNIVFWLFSFAI